MAIAEAAVRTAATWRLTKLVTSDELTRPLRERTRPGSRLEYLANCPVCTSVWVGALVGSGLVPKVAVYALALSAGSIWIDELRHAAEVAVGSEA